MNIFVARGEPARRLVVNCAKQFTPRIGELGEHAKALRPPLDDPDSAILRISRENAIVQVYTHFDDYLQCLIRIGTLIRTDEARAFLIRTGNATEQKAAVDCSTNELVEFTKRRVSFQKGAARLVAVFRALYAFELWPNDDVRRGACDLARLRNLILHHASVPTEEHAKDIETAGFIVRRTGQPRLVYEPNSIGEILTAPFFVYEHVNSTVVAGNSALG